MGSAFKIPVYINNEKKGSVADGEVESFFVPAGTYEVYVANLGRSNTIKASLAEHESLSLVFSPKNSKKYEDIVLLIGFVWISVMYTSKFLFIAGFVLGGLYIIYLCCTKKIISPRVLRIDEKN